MKQLVILLLTILLLLSCGKSTEDKAAAFAEREVKKTLNYPETYELVELKVDSAFTTLYNDETALQAAENMLKCVNQLTYSKDSYDRAKSDSARWSGPYMTSYGKEMVRQAKEKMAKAKEDAVRYLEEAGNYRDIIIERSKEIEPGVFCGWDITLRYRCANKGGDKSLHDVLLLADKDFENKIMMMDKYDYNRYKESKAVIDEVLLFINANTD